jgi:hypothetical protein
MLEARDQELPEIQSNLTKRQDELGLLLGIKRKSRDTMDKPFIGLSLDSMPEL